MSWSRSFVGGTDWARRTAGETVPVTGESLHAASAATARRPRRRRRIIEIREKVFLPSAGGSGDGANLEFYPSVFRYATVYSPPDYLAPAIKALNLGLP